MAPQPGWLVAILLAVLPAGTSPGDSVADDPQAKMGEPLQALSAEQLARFEVGKTFFELTLEVPDGLGPIFNQNSCASCHNNPVGGTGTQAVTRFGRVDKKSGFDPLAELGGSLLQAQAIDDECLEVIPDEANVTSLRITNGSLAYGLVEAIEDEALLAVRDGQPEAQRGVAHMVPAFEDPDGSPLRVGRFGWKAQVPTVLTFSADASLNEMGLTNRFVTQENAPNGDEKLLAQWDDVPDPEDAPDAEGYDFIDRVTDFQRFLAPPPQTPRAGMTGEGIFLDTGCAICHVPSFATSSDGDLEDAIRGRTIRPYGDFLLHDMGLAADGIAQGDATERLMKTPPLWGLRGRDPIWHDGRFAAGTFEQRVTDAILEHGAFGSQGVPSAKAFAALGDTDRQSLLAFLDSLGQAEFDADGDDHVELDDFHGVLDETHGFAPCHGTAVTPDDPCAIHDLDQDGDVDDADFDGFLLVYEGPLEDCNGNGVLDLLDILDGTSADDDHDGIPDECVPCPGDATGDGVVDVSDVLAVLAAWGPCDPPCPGDFDENGVVDVSDILTLLAAWGPCP